MPFRVEIHRRVEKHLRTLSPHDRVALLEAINELRTNPRPPSAELLHGRKYRMLMKLRVGDYRILYKIMDSGEALVVLLTGHRREVYQLLERLMNK